MKTDLSLQRRLLLFDQVLRGLDYAHRQGVVHRDLKPENLLISGDHAHAVIADFGIAMFDEDSRATAIVTTSHDRLANFAYAAPEQRRYGGTATAASDVFALGLILNELFTGEVPHGSGYRLIGDVAPSFAYLDPVIEDMIQNLPDRRVRTAGGIRERLQQAELNATSVAAIGVLVKRIEEARLQPVEDREPNVEIVKQDYINDSFVFWFNRHPDSAWMIALTQLSGVEHVSGYSPRDWRLVGDHAGIKVDDRVAADVARRFRGWLPRINEDARKLREAEARRRKAEAEAAALENATKERRRLEILQKFAEP